MKIIFFGNADFGLESLGALIQSSNHDVLAIVTTPSKAINRSKKNKIGPVKQFALNNNIPIIEQEDIRDDAFIQKIKNINADIFLVIAYKIIPKSVYSIPKYGAVNLHASILPQYRGAAPIQRAIINGDQKTGLSTFFINDKVDGGELIYQEEIPICKNDSFYDLWRKLSQRGASAILSTMDLIIRNKRQLLPNRGTKTSYASKINKKELNINWSERVEDLHNKIRAFSPYPCMRTNYNNVRLKIIKSRLVDDASFKRKSPGAILTHERRLFVECSDGFLEILDLQPESKASMSSKDFINGFVKKTEPIDINAFN